MNITRYQIILALLFFSLSAGCNKEPKYIPGMSVQGYRASISKILFSPIAFDGATVAVEGIVKDINEDSSETENGVITYFKLADLNGNYVNVNMPGSWDIVDDDYMIVGGVYRKNSNEIEASQFEKIVLEDKNKTEEIEKRDEW
ncbi:MAG: hypothetical protein RIG61_05960 [Deltaproteobacteria bacterium]